MPTHSFHIITVANDLAQYKAMREAFVAAGFKDSVARYTLHDNSVKNTTDPYAVLRGLPADGGEEPYVILCHQDVRPDLGHTATDLLARLAELHRERPDWAAAGNAGVRPTGAFIRHITDPTGIFREKGFPITARSLDENFLVIRRGVGPLVSAGLSGFHLYATDVCLNAAAQGGGTYVIDFLLTHLSAGNAETQDFRDAKARLIAAWRPRVLLASMCTPCTDLRFSRWAWIERAIRPWQVGRVIRRAGLGLWFFPGHRTVR